MEIWKRRGPISKIDLEELIKIKDIKNPVFFIIQKDSLTFLLCGLATKDVIKNNLIDTSVVQSSTDEYMDFVGFKFLEKIK